MQKQMLQESTKQMILETEWPLDLIQENICWKKLTRLRKGEQKIEKKGEAANLE